jgi:hypothetical protein
MNADKQGYFYRRLSAFICGLIRGIILT